MLKILLPVDFSEGTYRACKYALQLSQQNTGTQILFLNCFQDYLADADTDIVPPIDQTPSTAIAESVIHRNETDAFEQLEELYAKLVADLGKDSNIYLERKMVHGSPEDCIPEQIKQFHADLLVMHTDGESGLGRSIFGTITTKMVEEVNIPVLTIPKNFSGQSINRILYATDFDKADVAAISQLQNLFRANSPSILCVHIASDPAQEDQTRLQQLQQNLQNSPGNKIQYILLPGDDVVAALSDFVQAERVDLISLASRDHSTWNNLFNKNLSKKLVLESQTPLLIFQGKG